MKTLFSDEDGNVIATTPYAGVTTCNQNFQAVLSRRGELELELASARSQLDEMHRDFDDLRQLAEDRRDQVVALKGILSTLLGICTSLTDNAEPLDLLGIKDDYQVGGEDFNDLIEAIQVARKAVR